MLFGTPSIPVEIVTFKVLREGGVAKELKPDKLICFNFAVKESDQLRKATF